MNSSTQDASVPLPVIAGIEITIDSKGRFNLNTLHRASGGNKKDGPSYWLALESTQTLIAELKKQTTEIPVVVSFPRSAWECIPGRSSVP
jgi:hypothetical protein